MDRSFNDGMDYSGDGAAAAGSFFSTDFKKHDDLKQMLDSNRDNLKLEAMKRIIGMVAKGRDASELFPAVVKNVVSKNTEVKKLVYVYLVRYAEEQQDLALLSISTFQRALKDPNQLIRASALRVLSSIRVPVIVPIVMLAIRESAADMSPYVRKTAAHAIPKLYNLDADQKEELIQILEKLLGDRTTLVVGSAVMAFEELCPDRIDLIHKNYRKLCTLLVDVDEWGQVVIINMLTRYARTQFLDPNLGDITIEGEEKPFYEDDHKNDSDDSDHGKNAKEKAPPKPQMDSDHKLLLKNSKPLLQSRNAAVVLAVVQLYHHLAPKAEAHAVIKPLIRLLRSHPEIQVVVLTCMAAMSTSRKSLFESYMKSFFVRSGDPTQVKLLKLEILTNIASQTSISPILREFQTYISSQDKQFVAATIEAIGRCASNIKEVTETCLNGLVALLSHPDPSVVGGAVVVSKTLLQTQKGGKKAVISQLAKMVDRVTVPKARAAILWLLGEHAERIPHLPPDVLRKMAKTFSDEDDVVKLQIINLAAKLQLTNPSQTTLLCQYILNLAKYDQSYDIRDKARFMRYLLFPETDDLKILKYSKKILLASKPAPILESKFKDRDHFQLGSISHYLNTRATGYHDLADFPTEAPDPSVRDVELPYPYSLESPTDEAKSKSTKASKKAKKESSKSKSFYSDEDEKGTSNEDSGSSEDSESDSSSGESSESSSSDEENESASEESSESSTEEGQQAASKAPKLKPKEKASERKVVRYVEALTTTVKSQSSESGNVVSSSSSESAHDSSEPESNSTDSEKEKAKKRKQKKQEEKLAKDKSQKKGKSKESSRVDMLLDLDFEPESNGTNHGGPSYSVPTSLGDLLLAPTMASANSSPSHGSATLSSSNSLQTASAVYIPTKQTELINRMASGGLQLQARFTRAPHLFSPSMVSIELQFSNLSNEAFKNIRAGKKLFSPGMSAHDFDTIETLEVGRTHTCTLGVDFNDTTQGAKLEILWSVGVVPKTQTVTINAPVGEQIRPVQMPEALFVTEQAKLRGMTEHEAKLSTSFSLENSKQLVQKVYEAENLLQVPSMEDDLVRFAGQSWSSKTLVLVTIKLNKAEQEVRIIVNCEKMVVGSILLQELKSALKA